MISISQISYALALEEHGGFLKAAKACHVTQPTLSMQIQKMEEVLGEVIFDRSRKPVCPTQIGERVLRQFRALYSEYLKIGDVLNDAKGRLSGKYDLAVIPTLAPYLIPKLIQHFQSSHPDVVFHIHEMTTGQILEKLKTGAVDGGVLSTPIGDPQINETPLFNERLYLFHSQKYFIKGSHRGGKIKVEDQDLSKLILLGEGHCLRTQVLDFCRLKDTSELDRFRFETASIATLLRLVESGDFFTVLPGVVVDDLPSRERDQQVKQFAGRTPYREVGFVSHRRDVKSSIHEEICHFVGVKLGFGLDEISPKSGVVLAPL